MDSKRFVVELQKRSGLDRGRLKELLRALRDIIRLRAIGQEQVVIAGLGRFEGHKRMEFEYDDRTTGETLLYPPHIGVRFVADADLLSSDADASLYNNVSPADGADEPNARLKRQIAEAASTEPLFASLTLDALLAVVTEAVRRGEEVEVTGIGTFRVVNTERGARRRVVCTIDPALRDDVNAPFAGFEPVVIGRKAPASPEQAEPNDAPVVNSIEGEAAALPVNDNVEENIMKQNPDSAPSSREPEAAKEAEEKKQYDEAIRATEGDTPVSDGNGQLSERIEEELETDDADEIEATGSRRSMVMALIILLGICIIGFGIYFAYRVCQSEDEAAGGDVEEMTVISAIPTDSVDAAKDTARFEAPLAQQDSTPTQAPRPASVDAQAESQTPTATQASTTKPTKPVDAACYSFPMTVELRQGERLTLLALKYYGNKAFWIYIYEANKARYPNPDLIPVGAQIELPRPSDYGIDPASDASIARAKARAESR
jgi:nucleoid DNA-binding protein